MEHARAVSEGEDACLPTLRVLDRRGRLVPLRRKKVRSLHQPHYYLPTPKSSVYTILSLQYCHTLLGIGSASEGEEAEEEKE